MERLLGIPLLLSPWLGAYFAGFDFRISRNYFGVLFVSILVLYWHPLLLDWAAPFSETLNPGLFWIVFTGLAWIFQFWVLTYTAGYLLGGSFKQSAIVSATMIAVHILLLITHQLLSGW